jgi:hypothetical protein
MYLVLRVVQVVQDGGRIAKKSSEWRDRQLSMVILQDKMHIIVSVPPFGVALFVVDDVLAIALLYAPYTPCSLLRHEVNDGIKSRGDLSVHDSCR